MDMYGESRRRMPAGGASYSSSNYNYNANTSLA